VWGVNRQSEEGNIGVAFFISPTRVLTACHNLSPEEISGSAEVALKSKENRTVLCKVAKCDTVVDYAVLQPISFISKWYLEIGQTPLESGDCELITLGVEIKNQLPPGQVLRNFLTTHKGSIMNSTGDYIVLNAPTWKGDCGGALMFGSSRRVIGMHTEGFNAAREKNEPLLKELETLHISTTFKQTEVGKIVEGVNEVALTVSSLVDSTATGAYLLRLDVLKETLLS
jgi:hypothetical protein